MTSSHKSQSQMIASGWRFARRIVISAAMVRMGPRARAAAERLIRVLNLSAPSRSVRPRRRGRPWWVADRIHSAVDHRRRDPARDQHRGRIVVDDQQRCLCHLTHRCRWRGSWRRQHPPRWRSQAVTKPAPGGDRPTHPESRGPPDGPCAPVRHPRPSPRSDAPG